MSLMLVKKKLFGSTFPSFQESVVNDKLGTMSDKYGKYLEYYVKQAKLCKRKKKTITKNNRAILKIIT